MVKRIEWIAPAMMAAAAAVFLFLVTNVTAQQAAPPRAAKQMVPDNPSEHAPPMQPIAYSHKKHLAFGLECKKCHTNPEPGRLMTFPATNTCMECHVTIAKDKPSIQKLAGYAKAKQAVHGQVREMEAMSEVTSVTTMYSCLNCHEMNHAKTACDTCHKH